MAEDRKTFQTNIHNHTMENITDYSLFLGGLNVTHDALKQYDPLRTGYGRIFMIRQPLFVANKIPNKMKKFKHVLEYGNTGINGNTNIRLDTADLKGGYADKSMAIPTIAKDDMTSFTVKTYEFSGSLMREVIQYWINGISDFQSGFSTYYNTGLPGDENYNVPVCQANQTAEFIYVVTDQTGKNIEYAALFANCFPTEIKLSHFDYDSGSHELVTYDIEFRCTRYMSPQINTQAQKLLTKYNILMNSLNFHSGYNVDTMDATNGTYYSSSDGILHEKTSSQAGMFVNEDGSSYNVNYS